MMTKAHLPKGWRTTTVAEICQMQNGNGFGPDDWKSAGLPIIRIQNLNGGKEFDYFDGTPDPRWIVKPGQLLFAWAGTRGVSFGPCVWQGPKGVLNQHIFKIRAKSDIDENWLFWALRHVTSRIEGQAHGFKATLLHVKKSDIDRQIVHVPPRKEQHRIANVLVTWDAAITKAKHLLINGRKQKQAIMWQLLEGSSASRQWKKVPIQEIVERVIRRAEVGSKASPILMISSSSGFVRQDEQYGRYMAGKSVENYVLLKRGEFAYNKGNSKRYEFGCVYPLETYDQGLVPHVYVCFRFRGECDPTFYKYLFEADYLHDQLGALVNTGVRNNGLLNIRPADFLRVKVPVPPIAVQRQIAVVLETASAQIICQEQEVRALMAEKQALMQQLLTGKRRLNSDDKSVLIPA